MVLSASTLLYVANFFVIFQNPNLLGINFKQFELCNCKGFKWPF
jgi:hypothetical protein